MKTISHSQIHFNHVVLFAKKHKKEILKKIAHIIDSGIFLEGKENNLLEKNMRSYLQKGYVTTVASGHDAILITLQSLHLKKDDEVIFPVNAYPTAFAVALSHATAVPLDVDKNGQLDITSLRKKITKKTKAVILVHLYGLTTNIDEVKTICKRYSITLIEDCAQAFGTTYKNRPVGTFGDISCFSFYPTKNLATLGDGGALYTPHKKFYRFFLQAKSYGEKKRYDSNFVSGHSRMGELQAGIVNFGFKTMFSYFKKRKILARYFIKKLHEKNLLLHLDVLHSNAKSDPVLHLFVIKTRKRTNLQKFLKEKGVLSSIHYPRPVHIVPAFSFLRYKKGDFPVAERLSKEILSLPFHQFLSFSDVDYVVKSLQEFYSKFSKNHQFYPKNR